MLVLWRTLKGRHHTIAVCKKVAKRKRRQMEEAELRDSTESAFEDYGKLLETVSTFKYMGRVMTAGDDNWTAVAGNLVKAQKIWGRLLQILSREGVEKRVSGNFSKAVVQAVLLVGSETWVLTPRIERALESFVHRAIRRITIRQLWRGGYGKCTHPSLKEAMREAGLEGIRNAITRRQNTVAQYITT